jgi:hypothetical protein
MRYVAERERAAETSIGVNGAWLQRTDTSENVAEVEEALEDLFAKGLMSRHPLPGGYLVYLKPSK